MTILRWLIAAALALGMVPGGCAPRTGVRSDFRIEFELANVGDVETLQVRVTYTGGGVFCGDGAAVKCSPGRGWLATSFDDDDNDEMLSLEVERDGAVVTPDRTFALCVFSASVAPTDGNFDIEILQAEDDTGAAIDPGDLTVSVADIVALDTPGSCEDSVTPTTSTTITVAP